MDLRSWCISWANSPHPPSQPPRGQGDLPSPGGWRGKPRLSAALPHPSLLQPPILAVAPIPNQWLAGMLSSTLAQPSTPLLQKTLCWATSSARSRGCPCGPPPSASTGTHTNPTPSPTTPSAPARWMASAPCTDRRARCRYQTRWAWVVPSRFSPMPRGTTCPSPGSGCWAVGGCRQSSVVRRRPGLWAPGNTEPQTLGNTDPVGGSSAVDRVGPRFGCATTWAKDVEDLQSASAVWVCGAIH